MIPNRAMRRNGGRQSKRALAVMAVAVMMALGMAPETRGLAVPLRFGPGGEVSYVLGPGTASIHTQGEDVVNIDLFFESAMDYGPGDEWEVVIGGLAWRHAFGEPGPVVDDAVRLLEFRTAGENPSYGDLAALLMEGTEGTEVTFRLLSGSATLSAWGFYETLGAWQEGKGREWVSGGPKAEQEIGRSGDVTNAPYPSGDPVPEGGAALGLGLAMMGMAWRARRGLKG